jgi:hypothetical protein
MSWIVTLRRPAVRFQVQKEWTIDAQAQITLRPTTGPVPAGWLTLLLDAVVRPTTSAGAPSRPLSLQDFYELLYVMLSSLLDEIGPRAVTALTGSFDLLALAAVATPTGAMFNDFVPFDWINGERAEGSGDVPGAQWTAKTLDEIADPEARAASLRAWLVRILRDSGFIRGYERDIDQLEPPRLPPVPQMRC